MGIEIKSEGLFELIKKDMDTDYADKINHWCKIVHIQTDKKVAKVAYTVKFKGEYLNYEQGSWIAKNGMVQTSAEAGVTGFYTVKGMTTQVNSDRKAGSVAEKLLLGEVKVKCSAYDEKGVHLKSNKWEHSYKASFLLNRMAEHAARVS